MIRRAGLRLTTAELTLLTERGVKPAASLLDKQNRQALTGQFIRARPYPTGF
jgi:hypothetical protein